MVEKATKFAALQYREKGDKGMDGPQSFTEPGESHCFAGELLGNFQVCSTFCSQRTPTAGLSILPRVL